MAHNLEYRPLNRAQSEIRLLRVLRSEVPTSPIQCLLEYHALHASTVYEALSYTCGTEAECMRILVNETVIEIKPNLFEALNALRLSDADRVLWVDAICIHQADTSERNREVLRMLNIYRQARRVVIWLGTSSDSSQTAINHLLRLADDELREASMNRFESLVWHACLYLGGNALRGMMLLISIVIVIRATPLRVIWFGAIWLGLLPGKNYPAVSIAARVMTYWQAFEITVSTYRAYREAVSATFTKMHSPDETEAVALRELFSRPWFYRVWIVQESSAAREAIICCGQDTIRWEQFCRACKRMSDLVRRSDKKNTYNDTYFERSVSLRHPVTTQALTSIDHSLLIKLIATCRHCGATDPHDKIYALLGLAGARNDESSTELSYHIDYDQSIVQCFATLVRTVVTNTQRLDVLRLCDGFWQMEGLPSWTPDLTADAFRHHRDILTQNKTYDFGPDPLPSEPVARFSADLRAMTVRGFVVGKLSDDGEIVTQSGTLESPGHMGQYSEYIAPIFSYFHIWGAFGLRTGVFQKTFSVLLEMFSYFAVRYLGADQSTVDAYRSVFDDLCNQYGEAMSSLPKDPDGTVTRLSPANMVPILAPGQELFSIKSFFWEPLLHDMKLNPYRCHTYAPRAMKGDLTCMFIGAAEPYLLRKQDESYVLVGDATFGPFNKWLWSDCETEFMAGRLAIESFELR